MDVIVVVFDVVEVFGRVKSAPTRPPPKNAGAKKPQIPGKRNLVEV